jgi:hypothetical protein
MGPKNSFASTARRDLSLQGRRSGLWVVRTWIGFEPEPPRRRSTFPAWTPASPLGIAVHTGARIAAHEAGGEVLVSGTTRDLVAGSGIEFEDRRPR